MAHLFQADIDHAQSQNAADALADQRGPGHTGHPHGKHRDKDHIHDDIGGGGKRKKEKRCSGIAKAGKNARGNVIEHHKGKADDVNAQIQKRIGKNGFRGADHLQQKAAREKSEDYQKKAQNPRGNGRGGNRGVYVFKLLGAEIKAYQNGAGHIAAKAEGQIDQRDLIAVSHGSQSVFADKAPGHQTVGNVVQLLKNNAGKHGQAKTP